MVELKCIFNKRFLSSVASQTLKIHVEVSSLNWSLVVVL
jgi:hypothetical protein